MSQPAPIPDWLIVLVRQMVIEELDAGAIQLDPVPTAGNPAVAPDPVLFCPDCGSRLLFPIDREPVAVSEWTT